MAITPHFNPPAADDADDGKFLQLEGTEVRYASAVVPAGGTMTGDLTFAADTGVILTASDDSTWRLLVGTDGALSTEEVV